jgi:hypothetical protein
VVVAASGDWKPGVPAGYVEAIAALGGVRGQDVQERTFYILKEEYDQRSRFGYIIRGHEEEVPNRSNVAVNSQPFKTEEGQYGIEG